jgi:fatty acid desaturase
MSLRLRLIAIVGAGLPPAAVLWRISVLVIAILLPAALLGHVRAEDSETGMRRSAGERLSPMPR